MSIKQEPEENPQVKSKIAPNQLKLVLNSEDALKG